MKNNVLNKEAKPEQRKVPTICSYEDFECKLPGFLKADEQIALFFDFDGTLAPIAKNPTEAQMASETRELLREISKNPNVFMAVISGRGLKDVQGRVNICGISYGGNHGLELEDPDGTRHDYELPEEVQQNYLKMKSELNENVGKNGAEVEDKRFSLTYHYRHVPKDISDAQKQLAIEIIEKYCFTPHPAIFAIDAKPPVNWNKGEATLFLLCKKFGPDWPTQTKVIFAGDDTTDEDAMRALQGKGKTFRVSADPEVKTYGDFRLPNRELIFCLLKWINSVYKA